MENKLKHDLGIGILSIFESLSISFFGFGILAEFAGQVEISPQQFITVGAVFGIIAVAAHTFGNRAIK